jgi:hypothetical protein
VTLQLPDALGKLDDDPAKAVRTSVTVRPPPSFTVTSYSPEAQKFLAGIHVAGGADAVYDMMALTACQSLEKRLDAAYGFEPPK